MLNCKYFSRPGDSQWSFMWINLTAIFNDLVWCCQHWVELYLIEPGATKMERFRLGNCGGGGYLSYLWYFKSWWSLSSFITSILFIIYLTSFQNCEASITFNGSIAQCSQWSDLWRILQHFTSISPAKCHFEVQLTELLREGWLCHKMEQGDDYQEL